MSILDQANTKPTITENGPIIKTRDMTALDDLTHNFTGCPKIREYFIKKYGQSFENGKRIT